MPSWYRASAWRGAPLGFAPSPFVRDEPFPLRRPHVAPAPPASDRLAGCRRTFPIRGHGAVLPRAPHDPTIREESEARRAGARTAATRRRVHGARRPRADDAQPAQRFPLASYPTRFGAAGDSGRRIACGTARRRNCARGAAPMADLSRIAEREHEHGERIGQFGPLPKRLTAISTHLGNDRLVWPGPAGLSSISHAVRAFPEKGGAARAIMRFAANRFGRSSAIRANRGNRRPVYRRAAFESRRFRGGKPPRGGKTRSGDTYKALILKENKKISKKLEKRSFFCRKGLASIVHAL